MSSGARHGMGAVIGLIMTPVIVFGVMWGTEKMNVISRAFYSDSADRWLGGAVLVGMVVVVGTLVGSRLSPLASLIPGIVLTVHGVLWLTLPDWTAENTILKLPDSFDKSFGVVGLHQVVLGVLGGSMLVASLYPSRWRQSRQNVRSDGRQDERQDGPAPYAPFQQTRPPGSRPGPVHPARFPEQRPQQQPQPQPPQQSPAQPSAPGEWTQMYGGDDLRGSR